jgi:hypothetical protein
MLTLKQWLRFERTQLVQMLRELYSNDLLVLAHRQVQAQWHLSALREA